MGGGSYSYINSKSRGVTYASTSREEVFTQRTLSTDLDIRNKVRECCDSEEHPYTLPIIIGLDVTGSMGRIPHELISGVFPEIMKNIMDEGIQDPQVCFVGIGDHYTDRCPFQASQFEASDELMDKWLKLIYLEGGGGGNGGESYSLAWYFAARHTKCDAFNKGRKGILITIGDEPFHRSIDKSSIISIFGDFVERDITTSELYEEVCKNWKVVHINVSDYSGKYFKNRLHAKNVVHTETESTEEIGKIITNVILGSQDDSDFTPIKNIESSEEIIL